MQKAITLYWPASTPQFCSVSRNSSPQGVHVVDRKPSTSPDVAVVDYGYRDAEHTWSHHYVLPKVAQILDRRAWSRSARALDFGCGNGSTAHWLSERGFDVTGIDPSASGIGHARRVYPHVCFRQLGSEDDLGALGRFDLVTCIEVIEHCYDPRGVMRIILGLLNPGGVLILSTPYHGYLKNLALAIAGKMDRHFTALWDGGHIKFFSIATLSILLREQGFGNLEIARVGRIAPFAKSMVAAAERPLDSCAIVHDNLRGP